jgi:hypothetical protein
MIGLSINEDLKLEKGKEKNSNPSKFVPGCVKVKGNGS